MDAIGWILREDGRKVVTRKPNDEMDAVSEECGRVLIGRWPSNRGWRMARRMARRMAKRMRIAVIEWRRYWGRKADLPWKQIAVVRRIIGIGGKGWREESPELGQIKTQAHTYSGAKRRTEEAVHLLL